MVQSDVTVRGVWLAAWDLEVGGEAIRSPHCLEIQECCNPGFGICSIYDLSVRTSMLHARAIRLC